jgi:hypothetical protein
VRGHLDEVGNRVLAILRSLEDQQVAGFVRLRFEEASVVGASLGRHVLVACTDATDATDEHALLATVDEVRAILADHDLSSVPTQVDGAVADPAAVDETPDEVLAEAAPPPLVGARFSGAGARGEPRRGRRRFGRGTLSPTPGETPRTSTRG